MGVDHADMLKNPDAVQAAGQLGRLDFLMAIMASITVLLTIFALGGFWMLRREVISAAENEIRQELPQLLPKFIADELSRRPELIAQAVKNDLSLVQVIADVYEATYGKKIGDVPENVLKSLDTGEENGNRAR